MAAFILATLAVGASSIIAAYVAMSAAQRREQKLRRMHNTTLEFAQRLTLFECRQFLAVAQTGDQAELERRWPTWAEFRDAGLRGDYAWGNA